MAKTTNTTPTSNTAPATNTPATSAAAPAPASAPKATPKPRIPKFAFPLELKAVAATNTTTAKTSKLETYLEALSQTDSGTYPFSKQGLWHGGVHFTGAALSAFAPEKGIKAIADGEMVAYRLDGNTADDDQGVTYNTSFVLLRHLIEYPVGNPLTFFSLYMHTAGASQYTGVATHKVKTKDWLRNGKGRSDQFSHKASKVQELDVGTILTLSTLQNNRYRVNVINGVAVPDTEFYTFYEPSVEAYDPNAPASDPVIKPNYKVTTKDNLRNGQGHSDPFSHKAPFVQELNVGTLLTLATLTGKRYEVLAINGTAVPQGVFYTFYEPSVAPHTVGAGAIKTDTVVMPNPPTPVKAGQMIAKMGVYNHGNQSNRGLLHLEVFTEDDIKAFGAEAKKALKNDANAPVMNRLFIPKGTDLYQLNTTTKHVLNKDSRMRDGTGLTDPYGSSKAGTDAGTKTKGAEIKIGTAGAKRTRVLSIDGTVLDASKTFTIFNKCIDAQTETKAYLMELPVGLKAQQDHHFELAGRKIEKDDQDVDYTHVELKEGNRVLQGYVKLADVSTHGICMERFQLVEDPNPDKVTIYEQPIDVYKALFQPQEHAMMPEYHKLTGPFKAIYDEIDTNGDGQLEAGELQAAMQDEDIRRKLAHFAIKHPTEWQWDPAKWDALDEVFPESSLMLWYTEKSRIEKLCFWDDCKGIAANPAKNPNNPITAGAKGFPASDLVTHIHPVTFVGGMIGGACLIDSGFFFAEYAKQLYVLNNAQKASLQKMFDGINRFMSEHDEYKCNKQKVAYMLATTKHETSDTFNPINEYGGQSYFEGRYDPVLATTSKRRSRAKSMGNTSQGDGVKYRGRGFVQLTWKSNYESAGKYLGIDLVNNPKLALDHFNAIQIMIWGMEKGVFTSKKLDDYISNGSADYYNARKIINGLDKAATIKGYAEKIEKCIRH